MWTVSLVVADTKACLEFVESVVLIMATAISPITRQFSRPYLTLQEFKNAPTALDYGNLVVGGTQAAQDAELSNAITRASSWIDNYCNQVIGATNDVEQQRVRITPDGTLRFHPKYFPVVALTDLKYGFYPNQLTTVTDPSQAWMEEQEIIFPYGNMAYTQSSQGPLGFGFTSNGRAETFIKYSYINGYANAVLTADVAQGATTLTVDGGLGIVAGEMLNLYDGASTERVTVASSYTFGSSTVPLTAPLAYAHLTGVSVSNLPAAIKEAAILMTTAYLKIRGDAAMVMAVTNTASQQSPGQGSGRIGTEVGHVQELLKPFRRIR
jgi:hypothetical protein